MKIFKLIACVFLLPLMGYTQAITFTKFYDYGADELFNVLELNDGYLLTTSAGQTTYPVNFLIIKTDLLGDTLWVKRYGDSLVRYEISGLVRTYDGNFVTGSRLSNYGLLKQYISLIKFDSNGDTLWTSQILESNADIYLGMFIIECSDHGFLISGQQVDSLITDGDAVIIKTDSLGNYQWSKTFGGPLFDAALSSIELPDKGFLTLGWSRSFSFGNRDLYLIKTDSLGNLIWQKHYGTTYLDGGFGISKTIDGNYLLAGYKGIPSIAGIMGWIIKVDSSGMILWDKTYAPNLFDSEFWWAHETTDGSIIAAGSKTITSISKDSAWVVKTNSTRDQIWERCFQSYQNHSCFRDVQPTSDGGFACVGFVYTGPNGNEDGWLIKLDSMGCDSAGCATYTGVGIAELQPATAVQFYPNPFSSEAILKFKNKLHEKVTLTIYDIMGNVIERQYTVSSEFIIFKNTKATGVYFYNLFYDETKRVERGKFVIGR